MKKSLKVLIVIFFFSLLTACLSITDDENESESNGENKPKKEQTENTDTETESEQDAELEANQEEPDVPGEDQDTADDIVIENDAFKVFEPAPDAEVSDQIIVRGLARVFEGTVQYEFEDDHFILDEGFTTASAGGPEWGEFEIIIDIDDLTEGSARVILFEESAKDGSRIHELIIPVDH